MLSDRMMLQAFFIRSRSSIDKLNYIGRQSSNIYKTNHALTVSYFSYHQLIETVKLI